MSSNKNAATEDALGTLHKAVTTAFQRRVDDMLVQADKVPDEIQFVIDEKFLNAAANFLKMNEITCALPETNATSPLAQSLQAIKDKQKGKVLTFTDAKESVCQ